jgi:DNA-binding transcriptional LysR family regulator
MNLTTLYYFREVTKDMNISHTADRLYMSQQTLSNHIHRLEEEAGINLFVRKPRLALTYAGEHMLQFANSVLQEEKNLQDILGDIKKDVKGSIVFGSSAMRANACLPWIAPLLVERYPQIELRLTTANTAALTKRVLSGDIDFAITVDSEDNHEVYSQELMNDQIYLCVRKELLEKYYGDDADRLIRISRNGARLINFTRLPYCILDNRLGETIQKCFEEADFKPKVFLETSQIHTAIAMAMKGIAACFTTRVGLISSGFAEEDVQLFPMIYRRKPLSQRVTIIRRKNRYLPSYEKYFVELAGQYFASLSTHKEK